jgi:plasmid stabilization system protein ParE
MPIVTRWWFDRSIRELANRRRGERLFTAYENPWRAFSFIREIRQHCKKIAEGPRHYVACLDLGCTIRICSPGNC